jgi:hypothetical protein
LGFSTFQCDIGHRQNQLQAWILALWLAHLRQFSLIEI